ncbi:Peptidase E [uncultured archaeon]|nr:Peptidase E [uncultured archaeon]
MKKLLLTSAGLSNSKITKAFLELVNKPVSEIKVIFVPIASRTKEELYYVEESKKELIELEIKRENIKTLNLDRKVSDSDVSGFDVIYVCGGNTFYILHKVRENGFDKVIKKFVESGRIYFGVSAGSIIAGPNIEVASLQDGNDIALKNLKALNLTNIAISPHVNETGFEKVKEFKKRVNYQVLPLTDNQALLVLDTETRIIGD